MAKIDLNPDNYTNELWGRFVESYFETREQNDGEVNEVWRQIIIRQNQTELGMQDIVLKEPGCKFITDGTCKYPTVMHIHQSLWAPRTKSKGSELARFLESLRENANMRLTDPALLNGHSFRFVQWDKPGYTNRQTGQEVKSRPFFFIAVSESNMPHDPDDDIEALPNSQPMTAAQPSLPSNVTPIVAAAPAPVANGTTNGTANGTSELTMSDEDYESVLSFYADGKTIADVKKGLIVNKPSDMPDLVAQTPRRVNIMSGAAIKTLKDKGLLTEDDAGILHMTAV